MSFLRGVREGFSAFGHAIATLVNSALLLIVYVLAVGPTSIAAHIAGKRFIDQGKRRKTYWRPLGLKVGRIDSYYRQF